MNFAMVWANCGTGELAGRKASVVTKSGPGPHRRDWRAMRLRLRLGYDPAFYRCSRKVKANVTGTRPRFSNTMASLPWWRAAGSSTGSLALGLPEVPPADVRAWALHSIAIRIGPANIISSSAQRQTAESGDPLTCIQMDSHPFPFAGRTACPTTKPSIKRTGHKGADQQPTATVVELQWRKVARF